MSAIAPVSSSSVNTAEPDPNRIPTRTLDQQDFLDLVVAQLSNQDPLNPMKDTEFISQMAQFSTLEQSKSMQKDIANLRANEVLGRIVELEDTDGELVRGTVSAIQIEAGTPAIIVNGESYDLSTLRSVEPAATT